MNSGEALGIFGEIEDGIGTARAHPADIHFHADQRRIGIGQQRVVYRRPFDGLEFYAVIVEGEGHAGGFAQGPDLVEGVGVALPVIQRRARHQDRTVGGIEREGTGDVLDPHCPGLVDGGLRRVAQGGAAGMDAVPSETKAVIVLAKLRRLAAVHD